MIANRRFAVAALAGCGMLAASAAARADDFKLDPVHSMVVFQVSHFGASDPFGVFHGANGTITTDNDNPTAIDVSVPTKQLDMGNAKWTSDVMGTDWLNAKQFPTVQFKSTNLTPAGDNTYTATGELTLHGVTKPLTVTITKLGSADVRGQHRMGFGTTFKVKRSDFGMTTMVGPVGDEVTLMVNMEGIKQ